MIEGLLVIESDSWLIWQLWDAAVARQDRASDFWVLLP